MTRNKFVALIAATAALGLALLTTGTTGVLASWQDEVWGGTRFGVDPAVTATGYARAIAARGEIRRAITVGRIDGTDVTHSDSDQGSSSTGWKNFSSDGVAALFSLSLDGNSSATFDPTGGLSSTGATVPVADALSQMRNLTGRATAISSPYMSSSGTFTAAATCPISGAAPTAEMTAGTLTIGGQSITVPGPNETVRIDVTQGSRHFEGELTRTQTTTDHSALSELTLYLDQTLILTHEWTLEMQLVRAECGIGISSQPSTYGTLGPVTVPDESVPDTPPDGPVDTPPDGPVESDENTGTGNGEGSAVTDDSTVTDENGGAAGENGTGPTAPDVTEPDVTEPDTTAPAEPTAAPGQPAASTDPESTAPAGTAESRRGAR